MDFRGRLTYVARTYIDLYMSDLHRPALEPRFYIDLHILTCLDLDFLEIEKMKKEHRGQRRKREKTEKKKKEDREEEERRKLKIQERDQMKRGEEEREKREN